MGAYSAGSVVSTITGDSTGYVAAMDAARAAMGRARAPLDAWKASMAKANAESDVAKAKAKQHESSLSAITSKVMETVAAYTIGHEAIALFNEALNNAHIDEAKDHFEQLGGSVEKLALALHGTVNDDDVTKIGAMGVELGLTSDQVTRLAEGARGLAHVVGVSTKEAFDGLANGVGMGNEKMLKHLGLAIDVKQAEDKFAKSIGITADMLNAAGKKQATYNAVAEKMAQIHRDGADAIDTSADRMERLQATIENTKDKLYDVLIPVLGTASKYWVEFAQGVENSTNWVGRLIDRISDGLDVLSFGATMVTAYANGGTAASAGDAWLAEHPKYAPANGVPGDFNMTDQKNWNYGGDGAPPKKPTKKGNVDEDKEKKRLEEIAKGLAEMNLALSDMATAAREATDAVNYDKAPFQAFAKIADEGAKHVDAFALRVDEFAQKFEGVLTPGQIAEKIGAMSADVAAQEHAQVAAEMNKEIQDGLIVSYDQLGAAAKAAGFSVDEFADQAVSLAAKLRLNHLTTDPGDLTLGAAGAVTREQLALKHAIVGTHSAFDLLKGGFAESIPEMERFGVAIAGAKQSIADVFSKENLGSLVGAIASGHGGHEIGSQVGGIVGGIVDVASGGATGGAGAAIGAVLGGIFGDALDKLVDSLHVLTPLFDAVGDIIGTMAPSFNAVRIGFDAIRTIVDIGVVEPFKAVAKPVSELVEAVAMAVKAMAPWIGLVLDFVVSFMTMGPLVDFLTGSLGVLLQWTITLATASEGLYNSFVKLNNVFVDGFRVLTGNKQWGEHMTALGGSSCFTGRTLVMTPAGPRRIDALKVGDLVIAFDVEAGEQRACVITNVMCRLTPALLVVEADDVGEIETTDEHPFWVAGSGMVEAGDLAPGDDLKTVDARWAKVVRTRVVVGAIYTHNITVDGAHTYYVSPAGGTTFVLVHNDDKKKAALAAARDAAVRANTAQLKKLNDQFSNLPTVYKVAAAIRDTDPGRARGHHYDFRNSSITVRANTPQGLIDALRRESKLRTGTLTGGLGGPDDDHG